MFKNAAGQKVTLYVFDHTVGAPKTGDAANLTAYLSKDDNTVTVLGDTSATEIDATNAKGLYSFDLTQAETNADKLIFSGKSTTANAVVAPQILYTTLAVADFAAAIAAALMSSFTGTARVPAAARGGPVRLEYFRHLRADGSTVFSEDVSIPCTPSGSGGSIAAWTLGFEVYDPSNVALTSGLAVVITDASARLITATITGLDLVAGTYRWVVFRTNAGSRTTIAYGFLVIHDARVG